jgi:hypothetical protein
MSLLGVTLLRFGGALERGNSLQVLLIGDRVDIAERIMQSLSMVKPPDTQRSRVEPGYVSDRMGLAHNAVRTYFRQAPEPQLPTPRPLRAGRLDPYEDHLLEEWSQGERNAIQL